MEVVEMNYSKELASMTAEEMAQLNRDFSKETWAVLNVRRDWQYADAIAALQAEQTAIAQESASIAKAAHSLELLLPPRECEAQREANALLLTGKA
jgi:hypothetical protein